MSIDITDPLKTLLSVRDKIPFFEALSPLELKQLIEDVKIYTYQNKDIIFTEGNTTSKYMYYLLYGSINILKSNEDAKKSTNIRIQKIEKPSLFGELHVLTGDPRNATVEAGQDKTLILAFKIREFEIKTAAAKFYKNVIVELGKKITAMNQKSY
jgi:CRP-like cAMP-binding protein